MVSVLVDVRPLGRPFHYTWPASLGPALVGTEVRVPLHRRRVRGWVVAVGVEPPADVALSAVLTVRGVGPPAAVVELAQWAAWRWAGPPIGFLRTASAPRIVRALSTTSDPPRPSEARPPVGRFEAGSGLAEALRPGVTVLRLGPAADRRPVIEAVGRFATPSAGALVLVPEQAAVGRVVQVLEAAGIGPVHQLPEAWPAVRAGGGVAVGTRSAAWAPFPQLAGVLVLDAHDAALVEERAPTWSAVEVAAERARREGVPAVLVSPTPPVELTAAADRVVVDRPSERLQWPAAEVVDLRQVDPRLGLLTERVTNLVRWAGGSDLEGGAAPRRVAVVVNRRGGARLVLCAACGAVERCERCSAALELVDPDPSDAGPPLLVCRRCGADRPVVCATCGSTAIRRRRLGVASLRRQLQALVRGPIGEVVGGHDQPPATSWPAVVVGTEAVLRADVPLDAVVLADFDAELLVPRLGAGQRALALVARAGRALRRSNLRHAATRAPGRLVLQTRQPEHPVVRAAVAGDPDVAADAELEVRRSLGWPPARAVAFLSGPDAPALARAVGQAAAEGRAPCAVEVSGPVEGVWTVRAPTTAVLCDTLAWAQSQAPRAQKVRVDVDPLSL